MSKVKMVSREGKINKLEILILTIFPLRARKKWLRVRKNKK
jgi:hypothetical protein